MIVAFPNDNRGLLYHVINLLGQTVHAYRDLDAAILAREGDQRICIQDERNPGRWLTDAPAPDPDASIHAITAAARQP
jgi:hypothetical protein